MAFDSSSFSQAGHRLWTPEGVELESALASVTHLAIGAHADDLEFMAYHGIASCYESETNAFGGVVVTDGRGSARSGAFAHYSDDAMVAERQLEQVKAAELGHYASMLQLAYPSKAVKEPQCASLQSELSQVMMLAHADTLYLHNPFDRHPTHIAVLHHCVEALLALPSEQRPKRILGCEVWRDLDWLPEAYRVELEVDAYPDLALNLAACFQSQIEGGKRYDLAVEGRRRAHATFGDSHQVDQVEAVTLAVDMSGWFDDGRAGFAKRMEAVLDDFRGDVGRVWQGFLP